MLPVLAALRNETERPLSIDTMKAAVAAAALAAGADVVNDVSGGSADPGLLPAATFGFKRVAVNVTYMPEAVVNEVTSSRRYDPSMHGVFFLQLKLDASLFGLGRRGQPFFAGNTAE